MKNSPRRIAVPADKPLQRPHGHLDVLVGLPKACRDSVFERCRLVAIGKGDSVWRQGDPADYVVIVLAGKVISWYEASDGKAGTVGIWGEGDIVGLGDVGVETARKHTLRCLEPGRFLMLSFSDFEDLARRHPEFGLRVVRALSTRLRWVSQLAVSLATTSATQRVCSVLIAFAEHFGIPRDDGVLVDVQLTNEQLAAICGISRQFTNATLQSLRKRGLVVGRSALVLKDLAALERIAHGDRSRAGNGAARSGRPRPAR